MYNISEHEEMKTQLERKERECEERGQEKEEAMQTLNKLKAKLATETKDHQETQKRLTELTQKVEALQQTVSLKFAQVEEKLVKS